MFKKPSVALSAFAWASVFAVSWLRLADRLARPELAGPSIAFFTVIAVAASLAVIIDNNQPPKK